MPLKYLYKLQSKTFWTNIILIKFHCYFGKVYKLTVTKELKFLYLITAFKKYCSSKKVLYNDTKNLLSGVCMPSILLWFMKKKGLSKLYKLKNIGWCNKMISIVALPLFSGPNWSLEIQEFTTRVETFSQHKLRIYIITAVLARNDLSWHKNIT